MSKRMGKQLASNKKKISKVEDSLNKLLVTSKSTFKQAYKLGKDFNENGVHLYAKPFRCCVIEDFLRVSDDYTSLLLEELNSLEFKAKSNDLYQFKQSNDLSTSHLKHISTLRDQLFVNFKQWLGDVTDISLNETIDMSCAKYDCTDVLLCHDDELSGRRIAFVYYLVPENWCESDGGSLDLFSTVEESGFPGNVTHSIVPSCNSLVFFEVTEKSFHQVSEVLSETKTRLSVSGWFHGEDVPRTHLPPEIRKPALSPLILEDDVLLKWINPTYLTCDNVDDIQEQFEADSEIQLKDFLLTDRFDELEKIMKSDTTVWERAAIPNQRVCYELNMASINGTSLQDFLNLLNSTPFYKLLTKFTGVELCDLEEEKENSSKGSSNARRWQHGCYTLLSDRDKKEFALDLMIHFNCDDWDCARFGGSVNYMAWNEDEELLSVYPVANCLSLVYRDEETVRFTKYVNHKCHEHAHKGFHEISAEYREGPT